MCDKILIIEDHPWLRRLLVDHLSCIFSPIDILQAEDAESGMILAKEFPPSLVIMDLVLPGMSGLDATRLLKQATPNVPVIVLTAFDEDAYRRASIEAGADYFVSKTAIKAELLPAILKSLKSAVMVS